MSLLYIGLLSTVNAEDQAQEAPELSMINPLLTEVIDAVPVWSDILMESGGGIMLYRYLDQSVKVDSLYFLVKGSNCVIYLTTYEYQANVRTLQIRSFLKFEDDKKAKVLALLEKIQAIKPKSNLSMVSEIPAEVLNRKNNVFGYLFQLDYQSENRRYLWDSRVALSDLSSKQDRVKGVINEFYKLIEE